MAAWRATTAVPPLSPLLLCRFPLSCSAAAGRAATVAATFARGRALCCWGSGAWRGGSQASSASAAGHQSELRLTRPPPRRALPPSPAALSASALVACCPGELRLRRQSPVELHLRRRSPVQLHLRHRPPKRAPLLSPTARASSSSATGRPVRLCLHYRHRPPGRAPPPSPAARSTSIGTASRPRERERESN
uniref:Uncharacterized protein n=1 Tax=Oryza sativa subsp. japonica TaxID=39947 RepID=Q6YSV2_ORYSJ|nr:hypothetical protein [Oryza sativa Japonica Group]